MGPWKDYESILYGALSCRVWYCKYSFKKWGKRNPGMRYHNDERRGLVSHCLPVSDGDRGHCRNKSTNYEFNMMQTNGDYKDGGKLDSISRCWLIYGKSIIGGFAKYKKACYCKKRLKKERLSYNKEMICSNFMGGTVDVDQSRSAPYRQLAKINWNLMLVSFIK